jgi:hypothetical protein
MDDIRSNLYSLDVFLLSSTGRLSFDRSRDLLSLMDSLKGKISSLKIKDEGPFSGCSRQDAFRGVKCLHLQLISRLGLYNSFLQHLTGQCTSLEQLLLYSGETSGLAVLRASEQSSDVLSVLAKCPQLERLVISRARRSTDFVREVLNCGLMQPAPKYVVLSKILAEREKGLEDLVREDPLSICRLKELSIFTTTVSDSSAASVRQDRPIIREQAIGEAGVVQSWWDTFFQAKLYEGETAQGGPGCI